MVSSGEAPNRDEDILKFEYGPSSLFRDDFSVLGKCVYCCSAMQSQAFISVVEYAL